jgi:hypothetical protein
MFNTHGSGAVGDNVGCVKKMKYLNGERVVCDNHRLHVTCTYIESRIPNRRECRKKRWFHCLYMKGI